MQNEHSGSCLCAAVSMVAVGAPESVAACHCAFCRKHTGAPVAIFVDYQSKHVTFRGRPPKEFESSPGAVRGFCERCGSTIYYRGENLPDLIHLHIGFFDDPLSFRPTADENFEAKMPWLTLDVPTLE